MKIFLVIFVISLSLSLSIELTKIINPEITDYDFGDKNNDLVTGLAGDGTAYTVAYDKEWYSGYLDPSPFFKT